MLHFDALTGIALDVLGAAHRYRPHLEALGLRIVVPCRPGTFGSHYRTMSGLSQFTDDLRQLMDHLGAARATVLSQAFGSCSALAFAASAPDRVEQVLLFTEWPWILEACACDDPAAIIARAQEQAGAAE